eukprot:SAG11_NODE_4141_length_2042_cov_6.759650_2_plen_357_part_00
MSGRESGVVLNDSIDPSALNWSPAGSADASDNWRSGQTKRKTADSVSEFLRNGPTSRRRTNYSPAQAPPSQNRMRQGGFSPAQSSPLQNRMRQTEEELVRTRTEIQKLKEEAKQSATNNDKKDKELRKVYKQKEKFQEKYKRDTEKLKKDLEQAQSENENLPKLMMIDTHARIRAENKLVQTLNQQKYIGKIGFFDKHNGSWEFTQFFQRHILCSKWYTQCVDCGRAPELISVYISKNPSAPLNCEKMGPCPYSHDITEQKIEQLLSGALGGSKTKPCNSYFKWKEEGGQPCAFPAELCYNWHAEEDLKRRPPVKLRLNSNLRKTPNCAKGVMAEHCQEITKDHNQRKRELREWRA